MKKFKNMNEKVVSFVTKVGAFRKDGSAILETLMIIIICVAVCAIFKTNISNLFNTVWGTVTTNVQSLFS